jgi:hypothetical protein
MKEKPRRLFGTKRKPPMPPIPPGAEKLRDVDKAVDPDRVYVLQLPDGTISRYTGKQMIESAHALADLVDAQKAGDEGAIFRALRRIEESFQ